MVRIVSGIVFFDPIPIAVEFVLADRSLRPPIAEVDYLSNDMPVRVPRHGGKPVGLTRCIERIDADHAVAAIVSIERMLDKLALRACRARLGQPPSFVITFAYRAVAHI
jgi:hypothetical protein